MVKIGDRVKWCDTPKTGTITKIQLGEYPFQVKWDDGKDDWYDWYTGRNLSLVEDKKVTKAQELRAITDKAYKQNTMKVVEKILVACHAVANTGEYSTTYNVDASQEVFITKYLEDEGFIVEEAEEELDHGEVCLVISWAEVVKPE